jgi:hypothetical protein
MIYIIDTNIFIDQSASSHPLLARYALESDSFFIGFDQSGKIIREYERFARGSHYCAEFYKRLIQDKWLYSLPVINKLDHAEELELIDIIDNILEGVEPTELSFLRVVLSHSDAYLISPDIRVSNYPIERQYLKPDILAKLKERFDGRLKILDCDEANRRARNLYRSAPTSISEVISLLESTRIAGQKIELKCFEFKARKFGLDKYDLYDFTEAVCGLLNVSGGFVIIGATNSGEIQGVPLRYEGKSISVDDLIRKFRAHIRRIQPEPGLLVDYHPISIEDPKEDPKNPMLLWVLSVEKGRAHFRYNNIAFTRQGTENVREH